MIATTTSLLIPRRLWCVHTMDQITDSVSEQRITRHDITDSWPPRLVHGRRRQIVQSIFTVGDFGGGTMRI